MGAEPPHKGSRLRPTARKSEERGERTGRGGSGRGMTLGVKRAFISFDFDHDEELRDALLAQARNPASPFHIADWSVLEPFDSRWREKVRRLIREADLTIVICGEHTHSAKGVAAEVTITQEEGKPYFLLWGRPKEAVHEAAECAVERRDIRMELGKSEATYRRGKIVS